MKKSLLKSKIILDLKQELIEGNFKSLQTFWDSIETEGSPIIEKIAGNLEDVLVTFIYKSDKDIDNVVFIPPVGWNNLLENKMERLLETNLWYITYEIRNDVRFDYHFSVNDSFDDDWEKREERLIRDKYNKNKMIFKGEQGENGEKDEVVPYVIMPNSKDDFWVKERYDVPTGKIHEHIFHSENLKVDRRIRIYTPYNYEESKNPFGLLVLTDGNEFINTLSTINVLNNLISDKKIPPIVTVFIDSTETRADELMCNDNFANIIINELIPWVKNNYNISNNAEDNIIGGISLGGLMAAYLGLKHSEYFGNVLSQSGSYWYKPETCGCDETDCWIATEFKKRNKLPLKFYLNVGVLEEKTSMIDTNLALKNILTENGYTVTFEYFNSSHDYLCWGESLATGLIALIGNDNK